MRMIGPKKLIQTICRLLKAHKLGTIQSPGCARNIPWSFNRDQPKAFRIGTSLSIRTWASERLLWSSRDPTCVAKPCELLHSKEFENVKKMISFLKYLGVSLFEEVLILKSDVPKCQSDAISANVMAHIMRSRKSSDGFTTSELDLGLRVHAMWSH